MLSKAHIRSVEGKGLRAVFVGQVGFLVEFVNFNRRGGAVRTASTISVKTCLRVLRPKPTPTALNTRQPKGVISAVRIRSFEVAVFGYLHVVEERIARNFFVVFGTA